MCQWLSALLLSSCKQPAKDAVGWETAAKPGDPLQEADSFPINLPAGPRVLGGTGPPRFCRQLEGGKPFHDGGGHHARSYAEVHPGIGGGIRC